MTVLGCFIQREGGSRGKEQSGFRQASRSQVGAIIDY